MMISTIQMDKRLALGQTPIAAIEAANRRMQLAPLASLDCSITEPLTDSHTTTTDTPTLSGYFDCDQLSDMVDDSLFEITNAGCLSKSVFNGRLAAVSPIGEEENVNSSSVQERARGSGGGSDQDSGTLTPTNEGPRYPVHMAQELYDSKMEAASHVIPECDNFKQQNLASSQVAMVAEHQAYDYSSTSTIPAQSTRWAQGNNGGLRQRSKSARFPSSSVPASSKVAAVDLEQGNGDQSYSKQAGGAHCRKARSNPDVRDQQQETAGLPEVGQGQESACLECRQLALQNHDRNQRKKEKRRFTFSLFNLFSSGAQNDNHHHHHHHQTNRDDKKSKTGEICTHKRHSHGHHHHEMATSNVGDAGDTKPPTTLASNGAPCRGATRASVSSTTTASRRRPSAATKGATDTNGSHGGTKIKSRDSIKITNQRKQRQEMRASQTFTDLQQMKNNPTNELLLDLSQKPPAAGSSQTVRVGGSATLMRPSQSSYSVMRNGRSAGNNNNNNNNNDNDNTSRSQMRQTKSVKFTMHDKVMIVPSGPGGKRAPGSSNPPPAYLQPSAPIIKRSVPKSSSFSQTDSNRSLEELLAKYAVNNELIAELNGRLKLTETIASPMSVLDQAEIRPVAASTYDNNQVGHNANFTITNNNQPIYALNQANDRTGASDLTQTICCDPNSLPTSSLSSEAENAGFSRDWLEKQHRGHVI